MNKIVDLLEKRCLIFTDVHIGLRSNSEIWHKIALDYGNWIKQQAIDNNINTLIFMGDFFHNREEIGVATLDVGAKFLDNLSQFNIIMIVGNHDCYFKDNTSVNSLSVFKNWKNIHLVEKLEMVEFLGKKIVFMPWGFDVNDIPEGNDYGFGHLEVNSFKKTKVNICESTLTSNMLLKRMKHVYSGHFHLRHIREYENDVKISYIGNTYQQNWGECGEIKGIEIIDFETSKTTFIENTISPKHIKIQLSKLIEKDESEIKKMKTSITNNIVKLIIDKEIDNPKVDMIIEKLSNLKPVELSSELINEVEVKSVDNFDSVEIDLKNMLNEYVTQLDISADKDKILDETFNIYEKALQQIKSE